MGSLLSGMVIRGQQHSAGVTRLSPRATQPAYLPTPAQSSPSPQPVTIGFMSVEQTQEREALGYS
jgi:hypothetical protein